MSGDVILSKLQKILSHREENNGQKLLFVLAELFLIPSYTAEICKICGRFILDIVERAEEKVKDGSMDKSRAFLVALSIGVTLCPDLKSFAKQYLQKTPLLHIFSEGDKRSCVSTVFRNEEDATQFSKSIWRFVSHLGDDCNGWIQTEILLDFMSVHSQIPDAVWYCANTMAEMLGMSSAQREKLLKRFITNEDTLRQLRTRHGVLREAIKENEQTSSQLPVERIQNALQSVAEPDLHKNVAMVAGIMLPKLIVQQEVLESCELIPVESMTNNLRSLALAVASGNPVLLQGPVGSGKTSLVQYIAACTGRYSSPHLLKIQLGDQTDSKALLGTYQCTDIPGEFIWQPGVLTRAVTEGHWVLLEDIDCAPMDVVSILLPLLERNILSVPGHGDTITTHPNFQLFATQRLLGSKSGWHRQQSNSSVFLEKMWTKINVEPLSRGELEQVICTKYPNLTSVVDKLLNIYFMLSAGKHEMTSGDPETFDTDKENVGKFLSHDGRLISTRDLMNWCERIVYDFDVTSSATAYLVLQEALDCFVACLPKLEKRIPVAEAIGSKLNITKVKAEFYCEKYKPEVMIKPTTFSVGRVTLPRVKQDILQLTRSHNTFSFTRQSSALLERVAICVMRNEPVLLVGETGTGKTSSVQYLAEQLGHKLKVINMNQQSDSSDLLGGFKPVDLRHIVKPFREDFEDIFRGTFNQKENTTFLGHVQQCFAKQNWSTMFTLIGHTVEPALKRHQTGKISSEMYDNWVNIKKRLQQLKLQVKQTENVLAFAFIEGTLVQAIRNGDWVLLDEINLAAAETLDCLSGLLESRSGSLVLTERGDMEPIIRHDNFRLFACMNPATDIGKKDLSVGIRNRFTELYVDELLDTQDLKILVNDYLRGLSLTGSQLNGIVKFYTVVRDESIKHLTDGTGHRPHFSLRTLCRALKFAAPNPCGQVSRSLYEGFCLSFLTQLDRSSHPLVENLICQHVIGKANIKAMLKQQLPMPPGGVYLKFEGYWISAGSLSPSVPDNYILTPSVRANLHDLARIVSGGQYPVLLQGETSVGKTSLVTWLAKSSGNVCVRVNNHEHTDLQEYVGSYSADSSGKLVFKEGVLVEAMRKGHWIILDELNLAPTDVLEALNRLLDDNRELFIPETQQTVKAHPKFMLFATQNPPGHYGGRKMLSRAFRNRFVELHFDEIPSSELETILHNRCHIPLSYAKRLVAVMLELQTRRRGSGVFAGKQGFMTLRDLFRWAERYKCMDSIQNSRFYDWDQHLADHGYILLAGRVRKEEEAKVVQEVIQKHLKRSVDPDHLFTFNSMTSATSADILKSVTQQSLESFEHVVWTYNMRRLAVLIGQAIKYQEPILLVGETGCGKTTVCQMYSVLHNTKLHSINCHLHTESADFLGGLRPCRSHEKNQDGGEKLFEWVDGPLVLAMKEGSMFLVDEISLADDSVLERLNSVLEPERTLLLAEKCGGDGNQNEVEKISAGDSFRICATMNPGGDFGKKELSPALRNRFTEIWCPQSSSREDLIAIIEHNVKSGIHLCNQEDGTSGIGKAIMEFVDWFRNNEIGKRCVVSIRDILSWVNFINTCSKTLVIEEDMQEESRCNQMDPALAFIHGACLVFLDGLGAGTTSRGKDSDVEHTRLLSLEFLLSLVNRMTHQSYNLNSLGLVDKKSQVDNTTVQLQSDRLIIWPFSIMRGPLTNAYQEKYALTAPTTCVNAQRILRGLQLARPLLLEGSPGVGKTSLVSAIAKASGHELVRINLSEQTDVTDLFGADLPVEGAEGGVFAWRDGPLLQALKAGHWIVLDELNLASQSVLEGLNACLDHRGEVYIPELGKTFHIQHHKTRLFACQNPLNQGGGRKGLPRSFLNRFTQVYVEPLAFTDLLFIAQTMYPTIPLSDLKCMVGFNIEIYRETMVDVLWGQRGSPWEFNLRDLFRWCDLLIENQSLTDINPGEFVGLVYRDRMRTLTDKQKVFDLYTRIFPSSDQSPYSSSRALTITNNFIQVGHSFLKCKQESNCCHGDQGRKPLYILHHCLEPLESVMKCIEMNWMTILIGPQSSGKTCLVQLLSDLTGNQLQVLAMNSSMDTTELLGGFEQLDIGHHLEDAASFISTVITKVKVENLQSLDLKNIRPLEAIWRQYKSLDTKVSTQSVLEEQQKMKMKVVKLIDVVKEIKKIPHHQKIIEGAGLSDRWDGIMTALNKISSRLEVDKLGSSGGAFEWTDSLLVQALRFGHWLLIDNVNFCSASVLDRLNALLEPNGELSINERGVIDGNLVTIKPHPNFRLFLAMDPKFGEISRAMRNRGVEIYIPGEDEGNPFNSSDIRTMLIGAGIGSIAVCDWLASFHFAMKDKLSTGGKPVLLDLIHVALVTKQQTDRCVSLDKALEYSTHDVYVKSVKMVAAKQVAKEIWMEYCQKLDNIKDGRLEHKEMLTSCLSTANFVQDTSMTSVIQHGTAVIYAVEDIFQNLNRMTSDVDGVFERKLTSLRNSGKIYFSLMSKTDMDLHVTWITSYLQKKCNGLSQITHDNSVKNKIQDAMHSLCQTAEVLSGFYKQDSSLKHMMSAFGDKIKDADYLLDIPFDGRWNQQCLAKVFRDGQEVRPFLLQYLHLINRFYVIQSIKENFLYHIHIVERLKSYIEGSDSRSVTNPVYIDIFRLMKETEEFVNILQSLDYPAFEHALMMTESMKWLFRLYHASHNAIQEEDGDLETLALYWNWFYKKTFLQMKERMSPALHAIINQIHIRLGTNNNLVKQFIKYRRLSGHPTPFRCQNEADLCLTFASYLKALDVHNCTTYMSIQPKVKAITEDGVVLSQLLLFCLFQSRSLNPENEDKIRSTMQSVKLFLSRHGLLTQEKSLEINQPLSCKTVSSVNGDTKSPQQIVELWPLFEYIGTIREINAVVRLLEQGSMDPEVVIPLTDYMLMFTPTSPVDIYYYQQMAACTTQEQRKEIIHQILKGLYMKFWTATYARNVDMWLTWSGDRDMENSNVQTPELSENGCSIYSGVFSYMNFMYLFSAPRSHVPSALVSDDTQRGQVTLGKFGEQLSKLTHILTCLWTHSGVIFNRKYNIGEMNTDILRWTFVHFLRSACSLNQTENDPPINEIINGILAGNQESFKQIKYSVTKSLIGFEGDSLLTKCLESMQVVMATGCNTSLIDSGKAFVYLGLVNLKLLNPQLSVDPVEKVKLKLRDTEKELLEIENELEVRCMYHTTITGGDLLQISPELLHPHVTYLMKKKSQLQEKIQRLEQEIAFRPQPSQFKHLVMDIHNYLSSVGSTENVVALLMKLVGGNDIMATSNGLLEEITWQKTQAAFLEALDTRYPCYSDITVPFSVAVHQVMHGMRIVAHQHRQHQSKTQLSLSSPSKLQISHQSSPLQVIGTLCRFPSITSTCPNFLELVKVLLSDQTKDFVHNVLSKSTEDKMSAAKKPVFTRLLRSCLFHLRNEGFICGDLSSDMTLTFSQLLNETVLLWQKQEEQKKLRESEQDQLYRFKIKVHGDERSQDQIEEDEFRSSFPSYIKEFLDIADMPSLEQSQPMEEDTEDKDKSREVIHDSITEEDITDVYTCHNALFTNLTSCDWLNITSGTEIKSHDFTMPALSCHSVGAMLALQCRDALEPELDADIVGGHILACSIIEQQNSSLDNDISVQKSSYDIYHDPNVVEIMQCQPVLEHVTKRVKELQMEWPDHPTLKQILLIIDRILSFPVTSPVIKYLTGLELLVQKAQDWESNASRHVSLITELGELSTLIVNWRKMELGCWNQCLDSVVKKYTQKSYRWWFYLYQLVLSYVSDDVGIDATGPEAIGFEAGSDKQDKDLIQSFKQFMEKSTLGEYQTRLDMLKAFHCQLVHMDKSPKQEYLLTVLWNLHQFYSQFIDRIGDEIKQQRVPIEKELKNFVKIARWTDMNYWALKQTTEKTHRTLHKHIKEFEGVLRLPVSGCLEEKDKSIGGTEEVSRTNWIEKFQDQITTLLSSRYNEYHSDISDPATFMPVDALQNNLPRLYNKLNKHWSCVVQQTRYSKLVISLDEFTGDVIETVHELQQLEVSQHEDKEKQKSEAKHIGQKKRKALADLFKYLTTLGLSHRKGLILLNKEEGDNALLAPAFDLAVLLHGATLNSRLSTLTEIWTSCRHYYYRCITRKAKFFSALQTPSKELGVGDLERLKGFTEQLSHIVIGQYHHIADTSVCYKKLRELIGMVSDLKSVSEDESYQLPQQPIVDWINKLKTMLVSMIEGFSQFDILLNCCPKKAGEATPHPSPFPATDLSQIALAKHGDEIWNKAMDTVKVLLTKTKNLQCKVKFVTNQLIWTMSDLEILESVIGEVKCMDSDILFVEKLFNDPDGIGSALNRSLNFLRGLIHTNITEFTNWKVSLFEKRQLYTSANSELNQSKLTEFSNLMEDFIKNILMDIQKLVKLHDKDGTPKSSDDLKEADTEDDDILEGHLVKLMHDRLQEDVTSLSILKISDMLKKLTNQITGLWEENDGISLHISAKCMEMLQRCLPLLKKYGDIVEFYLTNQLAVNRTSGKLLSVLFAIFTELATKGFCMPAEYSDEMAGEGATEFADIEGGGIGEGEGVKDVSDQIETEDQLHEAKKPGEKEEESKDQPDVPSEDKAIEMSDDFDGKLQDLDPTEAGDESDDDNDDEDEDKLDKQMGEVDDDNENKLDEEMWGGDDDEDDSQTKEDKKEDTGPGADQDGKSELAAKDDIPEGPDNDQKGDNQQEEEKMEDDENNENQKPNELQIDESEYDEEKIDPQQSNQEQELPPETMDLPEDLNLDEGEGEEDQQQNTGDDMESEMDKIDTENQDKHEEKEPEDDVDKNMEENADDAEQQTDNNKELKEENIEEDKDQEDEGKDEKNKDFGFSAQDEDVDKSLQEEGQDKDSDEKPQEAEHHGKTSHAAENVEQSDTAQDQAGKSENDQKESEGVGTSSSEQLEGHQGQSSSKVSQGTAEDKQQKLKRKPGHSDVDRSIGSTEQQYKKLKTTDKSPQDDDGEEEQNNSSEKMDADLYQHVKDSQSHDAQTLDVATAEQQQIQAVPNKEMEEDADSANDDDDVDMIDKEDQEEEDKSTKLSAQLNKNKDLKKDGQGESTEENVDEGTMEVEIEGEKVLTNIVPRGTESTIHTELQYLHLENQEPGEVDVEQMRKELEEWLSEEPHVQQSSQAEAEAGEIWHKYEALTSALSQELCEQLRLVLEPSQATKLKGDYRTGKRLNMRKVIPYIASQFRKDKIWLRRTKPSKRNYQIMLAIDDSSSMVDNHSKQMAYESLALISNALTLLEAGELAICSFGETVKLLHPFTEQFTNQSGAKLLQHLKFEQKKTKIAQLLKQATGFMVDARSRQHGMMGNPETSQLMLIVSDGRGLFMEGMETVKSAVRQARELNIFLVFVIIDNPQNKDSILDIRVPVFKSAGQMPEIKSYMDSFPFPFYIILRDINSLPNVLCDALRQWFELVTSVDR